LSVRRPADGGCSCQDDAESKQRFGGNAGRDQRLDLRFELAGVGSVTGGDGDSGLASGAGNTARHLPD
jgi:hypothetical protein